jgi:PTH1 family peptidyl-tRNA hydrolase
MSPMRSLLQRRPVPTADNAPRKMIVGLGNPGPEYALTRHNVGFQTLDVLAERHGLSFDRFQKRARLGIGQLTLRGDPEAPSGSVQRVVLAKPMTYMNASGEAVGPLATFYKIAPEEILVVCDDLDLPLGKIRLRPGGGSGGQKGLASISRALGTENFARLRVGIGRPPGQMEPTDYVLQKFSAGQEKEMVFSRDRAADAIETWLTQGIEAAMNQFNA